MRYAYLIDLPQDVRGYVASLLAIFGPGLLHKQFVAFPVAAHVR